MDERELVMYNTIFPRLKQFLSSDLLPGETVTLPIPTIYFSSFMGDGVNDCLVIQNLCADRYFQGLSLHRRQAGEKKVTEKCSCSLIGYILSLWPVML